MALFEGFMTRCTKVVRTRTADGEGGWNDGWSDSTGFQAAIVLNSTLGARIAEAEGATGIYIATAEPGTGLAFHDVFRRDSDGKTFRVTKVSDPTPSVATFSFEQYQVEEWDLT